MTTTDNDGVLTFDKLPSGRMRVYYHTTYQLYGHLSANNIKRYNRIIKNANKLGHGQLHTTSIVDIYEQAFKTKCLRMTTSDKDGVLTFDKLPSGRMRAIKYRVNARKYCFRSKCINFYNKLF